MSEDEIARRIIHVLQMYPNISSGMLQVGIGNRIPGKIWRPILQKMLNEGSIQKEAAYNISPGGRNQQYEKLWLTGPSVLPYVLVA